MSKNFLNVFTGVNINNNNNNTNMVQLRNDFPTVFVSAIVYAELNNLLNNVNKKTSSIIRKLLGVLIPEDVWYRKPQASYSTIRAEFPNEYRACFCKSKLKENENKKQPQQSSTSSTIDLNQDNSINEINDAESSEDE